MDASAGAARIRQTVGIHALTVAGLNIDASRILVRVLVDRHPISVDLFQLEPAIVPSLDVAQDVLLFDTGHEHAATALDLTGIGQRRQSGREIGRASCRERAWTTVGEGRV